MRNMAVVSQYDCNHFQKIHMQKTHLNRTFFLLLSLYSVTSTLHAQSYLKADVIEMAEFHLRKAVGSDIFLFFELDSNSYYKYETCTGKIKYDYLTKGKKTKGKFISSHNISFNFKHTDFPYYFPVRMMVKLNSVLELYSEINLERIPDFVLERRNSNWLSENELNELIEKQKLKQPVKEPKKYLIFNEKEKKYYWVVMNTFYEEQYFSDVEILHLDPETGQVLKHYETRSTVFIHFNHSKKSKGK
jgi:hypothetical protein